MSFVQKSSRKSRREWTFNNNKMIPSELHDKQFRDYVDVNKIDQLCQSNVLKQIIAATDTNASVHRLRKILQRLKKKTDANGYAVQGYRLGQLGIGRVSCKGASIQYLPSSLRPFIIKDSYYYVDIKSCGLTTIVNLASIYKYDTDCMREYLSNQTVYDDILDSVETTTKTLMNRTIGYGTWQAWCLEYDYTSKCPQQIKDLLAEVRAATEVIYQENLHIKEALEQEGADSNLKGKTICFILFYIESMIESLMVRYISSVASPGVKNVLCPMHDGVLVPKKNIECSSQDLMDGIVNILQQEHKFKYVVTVQTIVPKKIDTIQISDFQDVYSSDEDYLSNVLTGKSYGPNYPDPVDEDFSQTYEDFVRANAQPRSVTPNFDIVEKIVFSFSTDNNPESTSTLLYKEFHNELQIEPIPYQYFDVFEPIKLTLTIPIAVLRAIPTVSLNKLFGETDIFEIINQWTKKFNNVHEKNVSWKLDQQHPTQQSQKYDKNAKKTMVKTIDEMIEEMDDRSDIEILQSGGAADKRSGGLSFCSPRSQTTTQKSSPVEDLLSQIINTYDDPSDNHADDFVNNYDENEEWDDEYDQNMEDIEFSQEDAAYMQKFDRRISTSSETKPVMKHVQKRKMVLKNKEEMDDESNVLADIISSGDVSVNISQLPIPVNIRIVGNIVSSSDEDDLIPVVRRRIKKKRHVDVVSSDDEQSGAIAARQLQRKSSSQFKPNDISNDKINELSQGLSQLFSQEPNNNDDEKDIIEENIHEQNIIHVDNDFNNLAAREIQDIQGNEYFVINQDPSNLNLLDNIAADVVRAEWDWNDLDRLYAEKTNAKDWAIQKNQIEQYQYETIDAPQILRLNNEWQSEVAGQDNYTQIRDIIELIYVRLTDPAGWFDKKSFKFINRQDMQFVLQNVWYIRNKPKKDASSQSAEFTRTPMPFYPQWCGDSHCKTYKALAFIATPIAYTYKDDELFNTFDTAAYEHIIRLKIPPLAECPDIRPLQFYFEHILCNGCLSSLYWWACFTINLLYVPAHNPEIFVILYSKEEGTGKNTAGEFFKAAMNNLYCREVSGQTFFKNKGSFDGLSSLILIIISELKNLSEALAEELKAIVTRKKNKVNKKMEQVSWESNLRRYIMCLNWLPVYLQCGRRVYSWLISEMAAGQATFWIAVYDLIANPIAVACCVRWLRDLVTIADRNQLFRGKFSFHTLYQETVVTNGMDASLQFDRAPHQMKWAVFGCINLFDISSYEDAVKKKYTINNTVHAITVNNLRILVKEWHSSKGDLTHAFGRVFKGPTPWCKALLHITSTCSDYGTRHFVSTLKTRNSNKWRGFFFNFAVLLEYCERHWPRLVQHCIEIKEQYNLTRFTKPHVETYWINEHFTHPGVIDDLGLAKQIAASK